MKVPQQRRHIARQLARQLRSVQLRLIRRNGKLASQAIELKRILLILKMQRAQRAISK